MPTIVTADTQTLWKRRVLIQGTNVWLHLLNDSTYPGYPLEYCENMSYFGNISHNVCDLCANGMNNESQFHYILCT